MKNVQTKDYLGKAKLVAASDSADAFTTFTGSTRLQQGINMSGTFVDNGPTPKSDVAPRIPLSKYISKLGRLMLTKSQNPTTALGLRGLRPLSLCQQIVSSALQA
jgi:hypothetical protein